MRLAVLDNDVIHDLLRRPEVAKKRLGRLHKEGLTTAITYRTLGEIVATPDAKKRERLLDAAKFRVDAFLDFEALDLVKVELKEKDPAAVIGARALLSSRHIETLAFAQDDVDAFSAKNRAIRASAKAQAPQTDPKLATLEGLATFGEQVRLQELELARRFLEAMNEDGRLGSLDLSPEALSALLDRGKATRMGSLSPLLYSYHRAAMRLRKLTPKPEGAMSDFPFLGAAAYAKVLLTADKTFFACGQIMNQVIAEPKVRLWTVPTTRARPRPTHLNPQQEVAT